MAVSYQKSAPPGSATIIADMRTTPGGPRVLIKNGHTSEPLLLGGEENQDVDETAADLASSTGFSVAGGATVEILLGANDAIYGRGGGTTVTVSVMVIRTSART